MNKAHTVAIVKESIRMKYTFFLAFALTALGAHAQVVPVLMLNAASTPLRVQGEHRTVATDIAPMMSATVIFNRPQWMTLGQKVYRYNTLSVQHLHNKGKNIVLQFGPDAKLYLLPSGTTVPESPPPPQPKGFPIRPDRVATVR